MSPPIRVQQSFQRCGLPNRVPGVRVYDLGQNFAGWPRITADGAAGDRIKLTPGELLDANGLVTQRSSGGPTYFTYTLRGGGQESWAPRFSYTGFRYVQAEGAVEALRTVTGEFVHLDAARAGEISTSSDRLNRIHALIDAAVRSNLQHVLTDCPHREKLGWLEQFHLMGPSLLYDWDLRAYLPEDRARHPGGADRGRAGAGHRARVRGLRRRFPRFAGMGQHRVPASLAGVAMVRRSRAARSHVAGR